MRFARMVFLAAGVWGVLIVTPLYFLYHTVGRQYPPPITHPDFYYGFVKRCNVARQVAFPLIGTDPIRFRPLMIAAILEKVGYLATLSTLYLQGRLQFGQLVVVSPDAIFGLLFVAALITTSSNAVAKQTKTVSA